MIGVIARHEAGSLLRSVQTWIIAAVLMALFAYLFLQELENYINVQAELALQDHPPGLTSILAVRFLAPLAMVFLVIGPLFAMRSFSDEFRLQTLALWQSSPVSSASLVIGKYVGVLIVLLLLLLPALLMPLTLLPLISIDAGVMASSALGLILVAGACMATGLYFSSLTQQALIAVVASLALLFLLWLLGSASFGNLPLQGLRALSMTTHLNSFFQGYLDSRDIIYFCLFIALFLGLTIIRLDALRHTNR